MNKQSFLKTHTVHLPMRGLRHKRVVVVASEFNGVLSEALTRSAVQTLLEHGMARRNVQVLWVPGAFELPVMAARVLFAKSRPDALIALGALIRGQTAQYRVIAQAVFEGLIRVSVDTLTPVSCGVIVAETQAQAKARALKQPGNRGIEAAVAALRMIGAFEAFGPVRGSKRKKVIARTVLLDPFVRFKARRAGGIDTGTGFAGKDETA